MVDQKLGLHIYQYVYEKLYENLDATQDFFFFFLINCLSNEPTSSLSLGWIIKRDKLNIMSY
jgi:hypothetical protein